MIGFCVLYDPATGKITGRIATNDAKQLRNYVNRVEITGEVARSRPELTKRVDLQTKRLIDLPPAGAGKSAGRARAVGRS